MSISLKISGRFLKRKISSVLAFVLTIAMIAAFMSVSPKVSALDSTRTEAKQSEITQSIIDTDNGGCQMPSFDEAVRYFNKIASYAVLALTSPFVAMNQSLKKTIDPSKSLTVKFDCKPEFAAHRGLSSLYPQNSVIAFEKAAEAGYKYFECDVHTTKDGEFVVIHDDTIDDMTPGNGNVDDYTLEELKRLRLDNGNGIENYKDVLQIPTLEETLSVCDRYDIAPIIELKKLDTKYLSDLFEMLEKHDLTKKTILISFTFDYLTEARKLDKDMKMMYLSKVVKKSDVDKCIEYGFGIDFKYQNYGLSATALKYAKQNGVALGAWTVDDTVAMDFMVLDGVELITTNKILPIK